MAPHARFDDLTPGRESAFTFAGPGETVVAGDLSAVRGAIARVEALSAAGWWVAGFVAYDAAPAFDPGLVVPGPAPGGYAGPLAWFRAFRERRPAFPLSVASPPAEPGYRLGDWEAECSAPEYRAAVAEIRRHIAAGDTYQVNHTYRMRAPFHGDPYAFYRDLVVAQRGGYGAFLDTGGHVVASASPERFFRVAGSVIRVKPMKGTMRRGRWPAEDALLRDRLETSEKERAENVMIVDLMRNDLGRIARFGSVAADRLLDVERYETLWQLTSEVSARLRPGVGLNDVLGALFPSGSVTGAPKQSTMEIIRRLETSPRGVYCGAIGFVAPGGGLEASFSVAIRTAVVDVAAGIMEYGVGGGITWDSEADAEFAEAALKADVLRGVAVPQRLLETMRWGPGRGALANARHLDRLAASAAYFGFGCDPARVRAALVAATEHLEADRLVRLTLDRDGVPTVSVGGPLPPSARRDDGSRPVRVAVSADPVSSSDRMLFHKTTSRSGYERRAAAHPDVDDVLLVNERGEVTESTIANLVARFGDAWVTPPLDSGCLPGTARAALLDAGEIAERVVTIGDLGRADEVALVSAVRGWRVATVVERHPDPAASAVG